MWQKREDSFKALKIVLTFWLLLGIPVAILNLGFIMLLLAGKFQMTEPLWQTVLKLIGLDIATCVSLGAITWLILLLTGRQVPEIMCFGAELFSKPKKEEKGRNLKKVAALVLLAILLGASSIQEGTLQTFHGREIKLAFAVPPGWTIEPDEPNNYVAAYSPEALATRDQSLDLLFGLKVEIWGNQTDEDINQVIAQNRLQKVGSGGAGREEYEARDSDCYYRYAVIKGKSSQTLVIGYFPEKEKEVLYLPLYRQIVKSIKIK